MHYSQSAKTRWFNNKPKQIQIISTGEWMDRMKYLYSNIAEFDEHIEYLEEYEMKLLKAHKLEQESKL